MFSFCGFVTVVWTTGRTLQPVKTPVKSDELGHETVCSLIIGAAAAVFQLYSCLASSNNRYDLMRVIGCRHRLLVYLTCEQSIVRWSADVVLSVSSIHYRCWMSL